MYMRNLSPLLHAWAFAAATASAWVPLAAAAEPRAGAAARDGSPDKLLEIARHALRQAEEDRLGELWAGSSDVLRSRVPRSEFVETTRNALKERGGIKAREWVQVRQVLYSESSHSVPAGRYANVEFSILQANGMAGVERVSLSYEGGRWHFLGYVTSLRPGEGAETAAGTSTAAVADAHRQGAAPALPEPAVPRAKGEVETAVRTWAAAWSARNLQDYLAAYAPDFTPANGQDRRTWEALRRARIERKSSIRVAVEDLTIDLSGAAATATFTQNYSAGKFRERGRKILRMQRFGTQWLIREEFMAQE